MTDAKAFEEGIKKSRNDTTMRLVYADWLDERNDPKGQILRIECAAATIMGWENTLSILDVEHFFEVKYNHRQLENLRGKYAFEEVTLHECKEAFVLFPTYPLNLQDLSDLHGDRLKLYLREGHFTRRTLQLGWTLLRKEPSPHTFGRTLATSRLDPNESPVYANTLIFAMILQHLTTGQRLLARSRAITNDVYDQRNPIVVGNFTKTRLSLLRASTASHPRWGVASARVS